jgi:hypothetical protein
MGDAVMAPGAEMKRDIIETLRTLEYKFHVLLTLALVVLR